MGAKGMIYVIKKDGTREEFNSQKIVAAVNKSAARIFIHILDKEKEFYLPVCGRTCGGTGKE